MLVRVEGKPNDQASASDIWDLGAKNYGYFYRSPSLINSFIELYI